MLRESKKVGSWSGFIQRIVIWLSDFGLNTRTKIQLLGSVAIQRYPMLQVKICIQVWPTKDHIDPWYIYRMVAQNMLRTPEVKKKNRILLFRCNQIPDLHHICASYSELPSDISTMILTRDGFKLLYFCLLDDNLCPCFPNGIHDWWSSYDCRANASLGCPFIWLQGQGKPGLDFI